jgi:hypothetical protein
VVGTYLNGRPGQMVMMFGDLTLLLGFLKKFK